MPLLPLLLVPLLQRKLVWIHGPSSSGLHAWACHSPRQCWWKHCSTFVIEALKPEGFCNASVCSSSCSSLCFQETVPVDWASILRALWTEKETYLGIIICSFPSYSLARSLQSSSPLFLFYIGSSLSKWYLAKMCLLNTQHPSIHLPLHQTKIPQDLFKIRHETVHSVKCLIFTCNYCQCMQTGH